MDRNEDTNEGGSSPDTIIARSSSEEEKQKPSTASTSGEYVTVGDSSSSLDTLTSGSGGVAILSSSANTDDRKREISRQQLQPLEHEETKSISEAKSFDASSAAALKKKKKKSHSLVRKLSLNKFRLSSEQQQQQPQPQPQSQPQQQQQQQEIRHTPEGGDSSRSQSQSSQESPIHSYSSNVRTAVKKGQDNDGLEREKETKGELAKTEKLLEKSTKTVTVVQRKTPSLTIKSFTSVEQDIEQHSQQEKPDNLSRSDAPCSSTLPYALSKWPERSETMRLMDDVVAKRDKLKTKSSSDSLVSSRSSPVEVRRKLSLLEEKRAIFQRRYFDTSSSEKQTDDTLDTVINVDNDNRQLSTADNEASEDFPERGREKEKKKRARQISVRNFDTFSTIEGTFDEESTKVLGYLGGIDEDLTESYNYSRFHAAMAPIVGDQSDKSSNNASSPAVEKREHLYKILVIGELGAGKTSIIKRYVHQFFSQHYRATIGVDFALKVLNWDPQTIIRLQLWDIAGQERFGNMTRVYYKEAVGAFIVFDVTRSATLDAVVKWKQDLDSKVQLPDGSPIPCVLLANKCDQQKEGLVNSPAKMDEYCKEKNFAGWYETSAKENINIEEAAKFLVSKILQNDQLIRGNGAQDQADNERFVLNQSPTSSKKSCGC
ncbi:ras and EF-hand domain-containing protein homolog isoform X2 [Pseudomyrmex gracilis]|uniref:ras and EF-hand domain-containing protein homolog isoform X2 n=1 Tax=Pseudomyrmex gracilis TaxID=219809 RepID=UPI00099572D0|nr:ras and EF-hand domain-containing protein homolog isoform X2 [Pseudomyrmex gracilis]